MVCLSDLRLLPWLEELKYEIMFVDNCVTVCANDDPFTPSWRFNGGSSSAMDSNSVEFVLSSSGISTTWLVGVGGSAYVGVTGSVGGVVLSGVGGLSGTVIERTRSARRFRREEYERTRW